jgi:hypothetical protein
MSERENNEIDKLLRGLARSGAVSAPAADEELSAEAEHLDADEMNAYAERALPDAARARYTAHLADCGDCRQIVSQLSIAVGLPAPERSVEGEKAGTTWKNKIAALLSPKVWRYAMPALVLVAVVGVGIFTLRQKQDRTALVAKNEQHEPLQGAGAPSSRNGPPDASVQRETKAGSAQPSTNKTQAPAQPANPRAGDDAAIAAESNATPEVALANDKDAKNRTEADRPATATAPAPPPADKTKANTAPPVKSADEIRTEEATAETKKEAERKSTAGAATGTVQAPRRAAAAQPQGGRARDQQGETRADRGTSTHRDGADQETEPRTVAGHRFTRKNGVWVDATFDSSRSLTVVTRGSEQYRALIADEPGIRTIADQLSGPVIVVWNGHTYRIQ